MWPFSQRSSVNRAKCSHWCFWRLIWHVWHIPWIWSCGAGMKLPVGGWGMSSWPPVEAEWRYSTVAPAFLPPGLASSGWTHRRWPPAGHSEWRGDSSCPKLPARGKKKQQTKRRGKSYHVKWGRWGTWSVLWLSGSMWLWNAVDILPCIT